MSESTKPSSYHLFAQRFPEILEAYEKLNADVRGLGFLNEREVALVKLALSVGAGLEGAVASHTRKAREAGVEEASLEQVALLSIPTCGFPNMMKCWKAIRNQVED